MMQFEMWEAESLEYSRRVVEIPHAERRARFLRELELSDPTLRVPHERRRLSWSWVRAARMLLGDGLAAAGIRLAGHRGNLL